MGGRVEQLSEASCSGGNYSQKNVLGPKVQGAIALGEIQEGCGNCLGGDYSGVIVLRTKV